VLAGGAGEPSGQLKTGNDASSGLLAAANAQATAPPPWKGADWPSEVRQARMALERGHIPDAYRDLVNGYFSAD
jgi:hypothetical protein